MTISSKDWRIRKSKIPAIELVTGLSALKKCIGSISPNTEQVRFGSPGEISKNIGGNIIIIDSRFVLESGEYPIPDEHFDVLIGLSVHEAGHTAVSSMIMPFAFNPDISKIFSSRDYLSIAEEIYTDGYIARHTPVQYRYLKKARDAYNTPSIPDWENIGRVWTGTEVYSTPREMDQIPKWMHAIYVLLDALSLDLRNNDWDISTRTARLRRYWDLIHALLMTRETRAEVSQIVKPAQPLPLELSDYEAPPQVISPPHPDESGAEQEGEDGGPSSTESSQEGDQDMETGSGSDSDPHEGDPGGQTPCGHDDCGNPDCIKVLGTKDFPESMSPDKSNLPQGLPKDLQDSIDQAIESGMEDLTEEVSDLIDKAPGMEEQQTVNRPRTSVLYENGVGSEEIDPPSPKLVKDITWVREIKNTIATQTIRGEPEGILDRRRLHRHYTDNKVFKIHRKYPRQERKLQLLVDASSSMSNNQSIYEACYALLRVIPEAEMLTYSGVGHAPVKISIVHINAGGIVRKVQVGGNTPTGRAMIVASMKFPDSLLIHFTDGMPNEDIDPIEAMTHIIAKRFPRVQIANIILADARTRTKLSDYWDSKGLNWTTEYIQEVEDFPDALRRALKPWYQT